MNTEKCSNWRTFAGILQRLRVCSLVVVTHCLVLRRARPFFPSSSRDHCQYLLRLSRMDARLSWTWWLVKYKDTISVNGHLSRYSPGSTIRRVTYGWCTQRRFHQATPLPLVAQMGDEYYTTCSRWRRRSIVARQQKYGCNQLLSI